MKAFFASLWEKLKGMFTKNLGIKISAVVFALLLWAYVLVVLNPVRTKLIDKVPISLEGYNDLLSRNLILVEQDLGQASVSGHSQPCLAGRFPNQLSCQPFHHYGAGYL